MNKLIAQSGEILALARSRAPEDREKLLNAVASLCEESGDACYSADSQALLSEIFMGLAVQAEHAIRVRLADRLAAAPWAPPALISVLALDDIEIARPVIARSPVLKDHDLVRLLVEATLEHQIEVARRPAIGAVVVNAILDQSQPEVMIALAGNQTAETSPLVMRRLVVASQRIAALRGSLAQHPKLTEELAMALYGWVGDALRTSIAERFQLDPMLLSTSLDEAVTDAVAHPSSRSTEEAVREREDMERRLVAKLHAADQLSPGYLLRALREGRLVRFEATLTALGGFYPADIRKALASRSDLLALACVAVGIDRSVFPTVLSLVRALNHNQPAATPDSIQRTAEAYALSPEEAAEVFRAAIRTV